MTPYAAAWSSIEAALPQPSRYAGLTVMDWAEFSERVAGADPEFVDCVVDSLYRGKFWLLRGAFTPAFMESLRLRTIEWTRGRPESFHKMLEGSPDFHRIIDLEAGRKYSFECCKHSAYFYRWNDDPLGIWPEITARWRVIKTVMGLASDAYERLTPKDGVVDRIQVVRYPPAIGFLEPHADPHLHQRVFLSAYMSKRGTDFQGGGFYAVGPDDQAVDAEAQFRVGDICIGYASVYHGVAPCDRDKVPDWGATNGRWFLSLYSNASDEIPQRHTGRPVKLDIPGVRP